MGRVTNRVDPAVLGDLVAAPRRATLAWEHGGELEVAPVRYVGARGRHFVALAAGEGSPRDRARASIVLDDGWAWFALRAVTLRGTLAPCAPPPAAAEAGAAWRELLAERVTAWDYGTLHEEPAP
jgi:hypothetical protein